MIRGPPTFGNASGMAKDEATMFPEVMARAMIGLARIANRRLSALSR